MASTAKSTVRSTGHPPESSTGSSTRNRVARSDVDGSAPSRSQRVRELLDRPLLSYQLVIGAGALLLSIGVVMVLSASSVLSFSTYGNSYYIALRQLLWLAVALPCGWVAAHLPVSVLRRTGYPALVVAVALLLATFTPLGVEVNGNRNWLSLGGFFQVQPSEIAKLAIVLWSADLLARKHRLLDQPKHVLIPLLPVTGVVFVLVIAQRDLGTALVLGAIVLGMVWVVGAPLRIFAVVLAAVAAVVTRLALTDPERLQRLSTFTDPVRDIQGQGWQAAHGFYALATGQFWGVGLGASRQKWGGLPAAHTDFIFAVLGEELGLAGTLVVVGAFVALAYAGLRISTRTRDPFVCYCSAGITVWLLAQALINIGMVLGLLPVIGIPLPLVSYGGSALVITVVALGLLAAFAATEPGARAALRASRSARVRRLHGALTRRGGTGSRR